VNCTALVVALEGGFEVDEGLVEDVVGVEVGGADAGVDVGVGPGVDVGVGLGVEVGGVRVFGAC
jgi:hypothetical protein